MKREIKGEIRGYNFIEIMVVVLLFSLLFALIFEILSINRTTWDIGSTKQTVENQARIGLENMTRELYGTATDKILSITGPANNQTITFQLPVGFDQYGKLLWGADTFQNYYVRYTLSSNQLLRQVLDQSLNVVSNMNRVLANNAQGLQFSLTNNLLTITLTIQKNALNNRTLSQTFSSKVTFRN